MPAASVHRVGRALSQSGRSYVCEQVGKPQSLVVHCLAGVHEAAEHSATPCTAARQSATRFCCISAACMKSTRTARGCWAFLKPLAISSTGLLHAAGAHKGRPPSLTAAANCLACGSSWLSWHVWQQTARQRLVVGLFGARPGSLMNCQVFSTLQCCGMPFQMPSRALPGSLSGWEAADMQQHLSRHACL